MKYHGGLQSRELGQAPMLLVFLTPRQALSSDVGSSHVVRVIEQCCFNSVSDPFNGQTVNFIVKPPKVINQELMLKKPV